jgi:carbon-monoxide dehydrogenase large subunit
MVVAGGGTVGSRSLQTSGNAMALAMESIVTKGKTAAASASGGGAPVAFESGGRARRILCRGNAAQNRHHPNWRFTLKPRKTARFRKWLGRAGSFESPPTFPNGCHICEVEVDPDTGVVAFESM